MNEIKQENHREDWIDTMLVIKPKLINNKTFYDLQIEDSNTKRVLLKETFDENELITFINIYTTQTK